MIVDRTADGGRYRLVAGERRLGAACQLRWEKIRAPLRENLSEDELREIEHKGDVASAAPTYRDPVRGHTAPS